MESILKHFSLKFNTLRTLIQKTILIEIDLTHILKELNEIEIDFVLKTVPIQNQLLSDESNRDKITNEFNIIVSNENYLITVNNIFYTCIKELLKNNIYIRISDAIREGITNIGVIYASDEFTLRQKAALRIDSGAKSKKTIPCLHLEIQNLIDIYPINIEYINMSVLNINYRICDLCGGLMEVDIINSELICSECFAIKTIIGTTFENISLYNYDCQKSKNGTFNPNRHFYFWWSHILAKEDELHLSEYSTLFDDILNIIKRDKLILRILTVVDIRHILKELKRPELNKNTSLILKKLTGIGPPAIPEEIEIRIENLFTKVIKASENIKRTGRTNRNYYPYYIYKIIDIVIPAADVDNRRVLYYIYIQGKETVECDDLDWEQICDQIPELTYIPTDRLEYIKYIPN